MIASHGKPAVAYYRMSTDRQETSIPDQRIAVQRFAEQHGYTISREYRDEGVSGDATDKRAGFLQMIADASERRDFGSILCWDQDRFGRFNSLEAGFYIHPLMQAGVRLVTVLDGPIDWHDFTGRIMFSIKQEGKNQFLRDLARNSLRGLISRAQKGLWVGGTPPYGYAVGDDQRLTFGCPDQIRVVRDIFQMRVAERLGYRVIAKKLNERGIPAPSGKPWSHDAVRSILTRETYCGVVKLGGRKQGKYFTTDDAQPTAVVRGAKKTTKPIRVEGAHPAIIERAIFDAAQKLLETAPKAHWRNGSEGAPLAGLLFCGRCGSVMYAQSLQRKAGQKSPNYICSTYHKGHGCGYCSVPQEQTMRVVANAIREKVLLGSPAALEAAISAEVAKRGKPDTSHAAATDRQIRELDRKIVNATERLVSVAHELVPTIEVKLLDLHRQREALLATQTSAKAPRKQLDPKRIAASMWQLDAILEGSSPSKVRASLSRIIDHIEMSFEQGIPTGRGMRYDFTHGTIMQHTEACGSPMGYPRLGTPLKIVFTAEELRRA